MKLLRKPPQLCSVCGTRVLDGAEYRSYKGHLLCLMKQELWKQDPRPKHGQPIGTFHVIEEDAL